MCSCFSGFTQDVDSLKRVLDHLPAGPKEKFDTVRCRILLALSELAPDGEWEKYNLQLKQISEAHLKGASSGAPLTKLYKKYLADALNGVGFVFQDSEANSYMALENYTESLRLREEIGDNLGIAESLNNIGGVYQNQGNISKSIEYYHKSLKLSRLLNNDYGIANTLNNLARIYCDQNNYEKGLEYYEKSLQMHKSTGNKEGMAITYNNIANVFYSKGDTLAALNTYSISARIQEEIEDKPGKALLLNNVGLIYGNRGDSKKALACYQEGLKISGEVGYKKGIILSLYNIGCYYIDQKNYPLAKASIERSLLLSKESGSPSDIFFSSRALKTIYQNTGNYKAALEMLELSTLMRDSIQNAHARKENIKKQFQYEFEEKENSLKVKQATEKEIQKALFLQKQQYTIIVCVLIVLILVSVFVVMYYRNMIRKKRREQAHALQLKDSEIKALQAQMNPHFIFNSLNSVLEYIRSSKKEEAIYYLTRFSKLIRMVLESSGKKTIALSEEIQLLQLYIELENMRFEKSFNYTISADETMDLESIEIPPLLTQPFIENAILHGIQNKRAVCKDTGELYEPMLSVRLHRDENFLKCTIEDNGIGRKKAAEIKSKKLFTHQSMGMQVTKSRLDLMDSNACRIRFFDLTDKKDEPCGTRVEVMIPIIELY